MATIKAIFTPGTAPLSPPTYTAQKGFVAMKDHNNHPFLIAIGPDSILRFFRRGADMVWNTTEVSALLELTGDEAVVAFDTLQLPDESLFVVVSVGSGGGKGGRLVVLKPFKVGDVLVVGKEVLRGLVVPSVGGVKGVVQRIKLGKSVNENSYPQIFVSFKQFNDISPSEDVARIEVKDDFSSWECKTDLSLPVNATKILDICPGSVFEAKGIFVLYDVDGEEEKLLFTAYSTSSSASITCPEDATHILAIPNADGESDLLIAANNLYRISQESLGFNDATGTPLLSPAHEITHFSVAANPNGSETHWTIWAVTAQGDLICFDIPRAEEPPADIRPVKVTGMANMSCLDVFMSADDKPCVVIGSHTGQFTISEPGLGGGLYVTSLLIIPRIVGKTRETYDCVLTVSSAADEDKKLGGSIVRIQASRPTDALIQGKACSLSRIGTFFVADDVGRIKVSVPKSQLTLRVDKVLSESGLDMLEKPQIVLSLA